MEFTKTKYDSLDGKTIVGFSTENFTLKASRAGVELDGSFFIEDQSQLQAFAKTMSDAWTEHKKLMPKITRTLSGH